MLVFRKGSWPSWLDVRQQTADLDLGQDESSQQSFREAQADPALGSSGHEAVQVGHPPVGDILHLASATGSGGRGRGRQPGGRHSRPGLKDGSGKTISD